MSSFHLHNRFRKIKKSPMVLFGIILFTVVIYVFRNGLLGSNVDWMSQHTVFTDYFRKLFYETGDLFPNYAANIGAGQNIYHFSYYGLLSPVILLSYLLPQVEMTYYMMIASLVSLAASCLLFYHWLSRKGFTNGICIMVSCIFLLSAPLLYHSYKQVMFVNYMPFLCLSLIGVDRYFESGKKGLLTISVFLMIMSSFYFSVGGIIAVILYGLFLYLDKTENAFSPLLDFAVRGLQFLLPVAVAVLMSGILVIPAFFALMESHRDGQSIDTLYSLLMPKFKLLRYLYSPYGLGLSSIVITVLLAGLFYKKRSERVLTIGFVIITVFPIFLYALNGGLYVKDKVLIPFLPVAGFLIALFFQKVESNVEQHQKKFLFYFCGTGLLLLLSLNQTIYWIWAFVDALVMLFSYMLCLKRKNILFLAIPVIIFLFITDIAIQNPDQLVDKAAYKDIFEPDIGELMTQISSADPSFYRIDSLVNKDNNLNRVVTEEQYITSCYSSSFQKNYMAFRKEVFQLEQPYRNGFMQSASQNPLFLKFMGVKYVRSDFAPVGYDLVKQEGDVKIYRNNDVFPLGYVTSKFISEKEFNKIKFPYRQELLLNYAVINQQWAQEVLYTGNLNRAEEYSTQISPIPLGLPQTTSSNITISLKQGVYRVSARDAAYRYITLPQPAQEDQVIFLQMNMKNLTPQQDISITVQNERNRLSAESHTYYNNNTVFHYAVSIEKGCRFLMVGFSPGEYEISSLQGYILNAADMDIKHIKNSPYAVSEANTKGDVIAGSVSANEDGWFVTTIPYDENYKVTLDGKEIAYEKVNTAFIGFPITRGRHDILFHYESPGFLIGAISSAVGFFLLGVNMFLKRKTHRFAKNG